MAALARHLAAAAITLLAAATTSIAADRYAVVITGAAAGDAYARQFDAWRSALVTALKGRFQFSDDHCIVLTETGEGGAAKATRDNVRKAFADLRGRLTKDDLLFIILIGHGTADEDDAKFNLVGPDLSATEWAEMLNRMAGRLVFIDTTGASSAFMRKLAAPGRIVVTATDSPAQQFETIFPGYFVKSLEDPAADSDKNGRVSVWEAFSYASQATRRSFQQQGQLPTERAVLDDNGDGTGREAQNPGPDGMLAAAVYFGPESSEPGDAELLRRRTELQRRIDDLRVHRASAASQEERARYDQEIETALTELARVSRQIRLDPPK
jgi:hypothetical protein